MRFTISAHGVGTRALRELVCALYVHADRQQPEVGLDGPEQWTITTPQLTPYQFARVFGDLVTFNGRPVIDALNSTERQALAAMGDGQ